MEYAIISGAPDGFDASDIDGAVATGTVLIASGERSDNGYATIADDMLTEGKEGYSVVITSVNVPGFAAVPWIDAGTRSFSGTIAESDLRIYLVAIDLIGSEGEIVSFEVVRSGGQGGYSVEV